ncbi:MAG: KAP family NTPase, partial [Nitrosomonas sp.]|nr:KAP family NTPase [Nitrosomonas sp.]
LISKCADVALKDHLDTKTTIVDFKKKLGLLIKALEEEENVQLPLFIFIDELDRCRPNYAIELLEAVKHLFGVPGIYFVIATNLEQLGHSICAVYGEKFDSEHYLKRFFDHEYLLPFPDSERFTEYLFSRYSLNKLGNLYSVIEEGIYEQPPEQALFSIICDSFKLGLRDREQIAKTLQAILLNWTENEKVHFAYLLFLIIAKHKSLSLFHQLAENQLLDHVKFKKAVKLKGGSFFKTYSVTGNESIRRLKEFGVADLLYSYHHYQAQTCKKLYDGNINSETFPDKIKYEIIQDCPRQWGSGTEPVPNISDYARRVSQSGQLSVSS